MQQLPRFNDNVPNDEDGNLSQNLLTCSPLSLIMKTLLPVVTTLDIGYNSCQWALECQQLSHLIGAELWNRCWTRIMSFELSFVHQNVDDLFSAKLEHGRSRNLRANISEWCYALWIELQLPARKS